MEGNEVAKKKKRGGLYCVAGGPEGRRCTNCTHTEGKSMHAFPKDPSTRRLWTKFVQLHRSDFLRPTNTSVLCSDHFNTSCFAFRFGDLNFRRQLEKGSLPTIYTPEKCESNPEKPLPEREKRLVSEVIELIL